MLGSAVIAGRSHHFAGREMPILGALDNAAFESPISRALIPDPWLPQPAPAA